MLEWLCTSCDDNTSYEVHVLSYGAGVRAPLRRSHKSRQTSNKIVTPNIDKFKNFKDNISMNETAVSYMNTNVLSELSKWVTNYKLLSGRLPAWVVSLFE